MKKLVWTIAILLILIVVKSDPIRARQLDPPLKGLLRKLGASSIKKNVRSSYKEASLIHENFKREQFRESTLNSVIILVNLLLLLQSLYLCFFGFRNYRRTVALQVMVTFYYTTNLFLSETGVLKSDHLTHQLGVFFGSAFISVNLYLICMIFVRFNYVFFGFSIANIIYFLIERFTTIGNSLAGQIVIVSFLTLLIFAITYFGYLNLLYAVILISAWLGSFSTVICLGILISSITPEYQIVEESGLSAVSLFASGFVLFLVSIVTQVKSKGIASQLIYEKNLQDINRRSFL